MASSLQDKVDEAARKELTEPKKAIALLQDVIKDTKSTGDGVVKVKETAIMQLAALLAKQGDGKQLGKLLSDLRPFFAKVPKAKTAKIVKSIIDRVAEIPNTLSLQKTLILDSIAWTKSEKRTFLRQRLQARLGSVYLETKEYQAGLTLINSLLKEVKKLDDKPLLVEIQLVESHMHHALRNIPRARAALTLARTAANAIYCPPALQAQIDMMAGTLHAEEKDYKTAYSYFYEAFEGFHTLADSRQAVLCLKYMLLCKIMMGNATDVSGIISSKLAINYAGADIDAMKAVAAAHQDRSLEAFDAALKQYKSQLKADIIIEAHLSDLHDTLLETNLQRLIEPYSRVEVKHVSKLIKLPAAQVETKLSQMILDSKLNGILDQGEGCLVLFQDPPTDKTYPLTLDTFENMSKVVDSLYEKAERLY